MSDKATFYDAKICKKCNEKKPLSDFHKRSLSPDGFTIYCIPCNRSMMKPKSKEAANRDSKKYADANRDKVRQRWKIYYANNKDELNSRRKAPSQERQANIKAYLIANSDKIKSARRIRRKNPTPKMIIEKSLRDRFYKVIVRCKRGTKHASCLNLIGCDLETFKHYIENKFQPGMSWLNHGNGEGKWNIDHIIPLVAFDLHDLEHQKIAFHYLNLRPIWFIENMKRTRKEWKSHSLIKTA